MLIWLDLQSDTYLSLSFLTPEHLRLDAEAPYSLMEL